MKFKKISFDNHPILGNISFDFTDINGYAIDTIIIAGENGCGKSVLLDELFNYNPSSIYSNKVGIISTVVELSQIELKKIQEGSNFKNNNLPPIFGNTIIIKQDFSISRTWNQCKVNYHSSPNNEETTYGYIFNIENFNLFKPVFSDVEINFNPRNISNVTSSNIDEIISGSIKSSNNIATEITQLLIDIDNLDNADLAKWVKKNPKMAPSEDVISVRMKRFTNAFHSIFPNKRYVGIDNNNGRKVVEFEEFGKRMPIERLSSGEKQIVFRGGFLLRNQKTTEGSVVLVDEPEISLHPKWQLEIMAFLKHLFMKDGSQTSQLIVATHSPFIIHNTTRVNDKVIVMKKNSDGTIIVSKNPEYYSWTESQIIQEAFNIQATIEDKKINVFLEGETDEKYYNRAMDVFGIDKEKISFKWIGRNTEKGKSENTGVGALNNAVLFFKANSQITSAPIIMLYDCDTNKGSEDCQNLHIRTMTENSANTIYKKGVENLLILPTDFNKEKYYSSKEKEDDYGAVTITKSLNKMKLCDDICSLDDNVLKNLLANIYEEIRKLLLIK
jgi:ABC-type cobalamin/Fe3+-siderophores transport system ATPase subunit